VEPKIPQNLQNAAPATQKIISASTVKTNRLTLYGETFAISEDHKTVIKLCVSKRFHAVTTGIQTVKGRKRVANMEGIQRRNILYKIILAI
jgi:hypothetical protein